MSEKSVFIFLLAFFYLVFINTANCQQSGGKKQIYKRHVEKGDSLMNIKQYQSAMQEFQRASEVLPFEEYPRLQMQKIETIIGVQELEEKKKQELVDNAVKNADTSKPAIVQQPEKKTESTIVSKDSVKNVFDKYKNLQKDLKNIADDGTKSEILTEIAGEFKEINERGKALELYSKSLDIEQQQGNLGKASVILEEMSEVYLDSGLYKNSIEALEKSAEMKKNTGDETGVSEVLSKIGKVHETTYNYQQALDNYSKSAEAKTKINDKKGLSDVMDNIGNIYYKQQVLEKSIDSYKKSAELNEQLNNTEELGTTYNKMGVALYEMGSYEEAEQYYVKSVELKKKSGNDKDASMALNNLGNINYDQNKYKKAISYYEQSLELKDNTNYTYGKAVSLFNLGNAYSQVGSKNEAIKYFENCRAISSQNNFEELLARSLKALSKLYNENDEPGKAAPLESLLATSNFKDVDINTQLSESQILGEVDENQRLITYLTEEVVKQKEIAEREALERARENQLNNQRLRLKNEQIKKQRIFLGSLIIVIILVIGVLALIYYQMVQKRKANILLTEKNNLISKQAKLIYDNIKSASAIQKAAMPPDAEMENELPQHFVLNMPKDIVSGDFYWMDKRDGKLFVAVADCTGHGVQGAVVSMLGMALLNEIVNKSYISHSGEILSQLSTKLKESLHASGDIAEIREGMDIVLCKFNKEMNEIEFAGANNPVYIIRNKELIEYRGDRSPIGYYSKEVDFTNQSIKLEKGDSIYMFSDGYADQLNGADYKKFLSKRFKELLIEIEPLSMDERSKTLIDRFNKWRGSFQQVDDVMVMCIKV